MAAQNFTPPYPFEHRVSPEDILAYNEAVDRDEVRKLFRAWSAEDDARAVEGAKVEAERNEKLAMQGALKALVQSSESLQQASGMNHKVWLDRQEAARYLGVSTRTIDRKRERGELRGYLVEGTKTFRFKKTELDELMEG
ncbi:helix-turn-helix domain-containing protein [Ruficoccus sp. ZRK36]|uniref:helix-turn-helix domain-containing protein n=1 Tax=Ruficoccus sp. ZRK36 TaxID=2866311 RepID=UPI001C732FE4|nr:helix-turn-helix domain-containing protein [Ruficoccus sp. ZRK36]QYY36722.1 helix-turn-helix domain-containing protein [Ruficoccus sp. ZRK36]